MTEFDRLKENLIKLRLKAMAQHLDDVLQRAKEKNMDLPATLNCLAEIELNQRWQTAINMPGTILSQAPIMTSASKA